MAKKTTKTTNVTKLKVRVMVDGCTVKMQVLEQPERMRRHDGSIYLASIGGVELISAAAPELRRDKVFIRGSSAYYDNDIAEHECATPAEAQSYANTIRELVALANRRKPTPFPSKKWVVCE